MFKILAGWNFKIQCLSPVFLFRGLTQAGFVLLGKMLYLKLLFIAIDNCVFKRSAAMLIKTGGILSWAIAFLGVNFWLHSSYLTSSLYTGGKIALSLVFSFAVIVLLIILKMLGWF